MITTDFTCKIADFGLSKFFKEGLGEHVEEFKDDDNKSCISSYQIGTPLYRPPEFVKVKVYDCRADVYSLGLIYFEMLNEFNTMHERYKKIGEFKQTGVSEEFRKQFEKESRLIEFMCINDFSIRPTSQQVLKSKEFLELVRFYQTDPNFV